MKVSEIFQSIDGEAVRMGMLANFIRLSGCNLRCNYCDTKYAQEDNGKEMSISQIISKLDPKIKNVTLTGGEPLWKEDEVRKLLTTLIAYGYMVSVETNGSVDLTSFISTFKDVCYIVDYKTPSSGMEEKMIINNYKILRESDAIKFVVGNRNDLDCMMQIIESIKAQLYISPIFGEIELEEIVNYMKEKNLTKVRLQVQLHKLIWDKDKKGV